MDKSKETERQKIILDIIDYLGKVYHHWTMNDLKIVSANLYRNFYPFQKARGITVLEIVSEGCDILNKRQPNKAITIKYWKNKDFHKELKRIYKDKKAYEELTEEEANAIQKETFSDFDDNKRIALYADEIKKKNELTPQEAELFELLIDLIMADLGGNIYKYLNIVAVELGLTNKDTTFRKAFERLKNKLLAPPNKGSRDLLHLATKETEEQEVVLKDFIDYVDNSVIIKSDFLQAYRFSEQEMKKMIELKKIFAENGFEIDRFPEVYIDEEYVIDEEEISYLNIDKLGCYKYAINEDKTTEEGIIIIYSSAIEFYCQIMKINSDDVKFVVLMHELGHWLTHWSRYKDKSNWIIGYKADVHNKTHESLAQLIAYWSVEGNHELEKTLEKLTPNDSENPYYLYKNLIEIDKKNVLIKLTEIRKNPDFKLSKEEDIDDTLYDFLKSKYINIDEFKKEKGGYITGKKYGI
jgi:hypothetical protein